MNKELKIAIIVCVLSLIFMIGCSSYATTKEKEILLYNTIVIGGEEFSTSDIKNISYSSGYSRQIKIEFKDGTVAYTDCYILKDN